MEIVRWKESVPTCARPVIAKAGEVKWGLEPLRGLFTARASMLVSLKLYSGAGAFVLRPQGRMI
jgi:uncharacterized protein YigE (DUF2233 family)